MAVSISMCQLVLLGRVVLMSSHLQGITSSPSLSSSTLQQLCDQFIGFRLACRKRWTSLIYTTESDPFGLKLGWENRWEVAANALEWLEGYRFITSEDRRLERLDFASMRVLRVCTDVFFVNRHISDMAPLAAAFSWSKTLLPETGIREFAGTYVGYAFKVPNTMICISSALGAVLLENISTFHSSDSSTAPSREFSSNIFTPEKILVRFRVIWKRIYIFLLTSSPEFRKNNEAYRRSVAESKVPRGAATAIRCDVDAF
ncbi:hypothetical protein BV25DRAFT_1843776 [Artomyces pyxidatus]|uniref:Uncharacterized protein n=1 Tax=Artomyces pyxidatus TaxID=48021 RepID=A0ACB8SET6_9AGAM|nr:hypothetical protein BV25DRAFT_1843776 [Artomyces pyxidatus]